MRLDRGFALITTLLLAAVMLMLVLALLQSSMLSMRIADSGQQSLQLRQDAWRMHLQQPVSTGTSLSEVRCPAQYAAWHADSLHCQRYILLSPPEPGLWQSSQVGSIQLQLRLTVQDVSDD
ncbi:PilX N-terminal domain-containing pilus assembly protein [Alkalimonas amylolytica]|uniref:PilX N-terminal n=1 Tax=Alkalimonas amylolytica TaxID=152573 RepID=A0A1H4FND6_ALKAM|nr:PilX N-terminal domain-containing pilus assembly protein [Alkalimonas amylolytica]SEA98002.1 PilX N-terminal [Alkalimonas amylolytica]